MWPSETSDPATWRTRRPAPLRAPSWAAGQALLPADRARTRTPTRGRTKAGTKAGAGGARRGAALPLVILLLAVLAMFTMTAVSLFLGSLTIDSESVAGARADCLAELGRADAFAHVVRNPGGPWVGRSLTTVTDDAGVDAGQYY